MLPWASDQRATQRSATYCVAALKGGLSPGETRPNRQLPLLDHVSVLTSVVLVGPQRGGTARMHLKIKICHQISCETLIC